MSTEKARASEEAAAMLAAGKCFSAAEEDIFNEQNRNTADILAGPAKRFGEMTCFQRKGEKRKGGADATYSRDILTYEALS